MNKFEQMLTIDAEKFATAIKNGIGWIAENNIIPEFFGMFPEYDVAIFDEDMIEQVVEEYLNDSGVEVREGDGLVEGEDY